MDEKPIESNGADVDRSALIDVPISLARAEFQLKACAYRNKNSGYEALALINKSTLGLGEGCLTARIHSGCVTGDVFHSLRCDCHAQLQAALSCITSTPNAVLIYLPYHEGRGIELFDKIRAYAMQDLGLDTVDANLRIGAPIDAREYDLAAHIIVDLGFSKVRLLTNNPSKIEALCSQGIQVVQQIPLTVASSCHHERYLETKRRRLRHHL